MSSHARHRSSHHHHDHHLKPDADRRYLSAALALIAGFMAVEVVVGLLAGSLALISDAAHMLTDALSLVLALCAMRLARRPARGRWTYGLQRAEILSAQVNGITLLLLAAVLGYESLRRLIAPPPVEGGLVLVTALVGLAVNAVAVVLIGKANRGSLNVEGAFQHVLNDLWAFAGTAAAGAVVLLTGWRRADAVASLVIVALMAKAGYALVKESWKILLEAAPQHLDPDVIGAELAARPGVREVHDLHVWTITSHYPALSAHVLVDPDRDREAVQAELRDQLLHTHGISHVTLQVDHVAPGAPDEEHCADPHGPVHRALR
ncbi:cobalt-zinc-cadmium efflux system protein [Streptomyces sp. CG 926]|uniref:cation diffusion facilitator family transporter n=1 Tax=Streptomyces sp. CG 926 TaxID=1882405 RepID=UPI000D6CAD63|nr:cation diffusion facilitator family transporter [Streptomyces sp. CG 926]PWK65112.1 cobalt-zinc-cadmium efflux system protein [Streptomyces sp. CG 926]